MSKRVFVGEMHQESEEVKQAMADALSAGQKAMTGHILKINKVNAADYQGNGGAKWASIVPIWDHTESRQELEFHCACSAIFRTAFPGAVATLVKCPSCARETQIAIRKKKWTY